jgi:formiminotetrahydrofolate cyclodeaminase
MSYANDTLDTFSARLASKASTPGGGAAAGLAGALGAALAAMVANLTAGKEKFATVEGQMQEVIAHADRLRADLLALMDRDTEAFDQVMACYRMPRESDADKATRKQALQTALDAAAEAALAICRACAAVIPLCRTTAEHGNSMLVSDAGCAVAFAEAGLQAALITVKINADSLADRHRADALWQEGQGLAITAAQERQNVLEIVYRRLG